MPTNFCAFGLSLYSNCKIKSAKKSAHKILFKLITGYSDILCPESTIIQFFNDAEINGFVNLLRSGLLFINAVAFLESKEKK